MSKRLPVLILFTFLFCPAPGIAATETDISDWPQWRGPHRDAVSRETGLVDGWGDQGPEILWRIDAGHGFSSVSVSQDKLYTLWDEKEKQLLFCLDAATGEELWRHELGPAFEHHYGNGPRSTPVIDDGVVFAIGTGGQLLAADQHTGKTVWQRNMVSDVDTELPSYGDSSSPLIVDDKLIIEAGGKNATFAALDKKTGKIAWTAENDQPAYSSPIEIEVDDISQVVFWSAHGLHSVATETGKVLWRYSWETFCPVTGDPLNTGTPIFIAPDRIFLSSGSGAAVIRLTRTGDKFRVEDVWESDELRSDVNTALLTNGQIYGFDRGTLKSVDVATGEVRWKARGFQRGSLIAADGKLIVLGEQGNLALVAANPKEYVEQSTAQVLEGRNWTSPTLAGGRLYLRNQEEIVCVDMRSH
jgi:outer membrane protein assembly factor BamB